MFKHFSCTGGRAIERKLGKHYTEDDISPVQKGPRLLRNGNSDLEEEAIQSLNKGSGIFNEHLM